MSRNFTSPGIVLRSRHSGEKNRVLDILTPTRGILRATAYGAQSPRSKLRSSAQAFHAGELFFYEDPVKHFIKLTDMDVRQEFHRIRSSTAAMYAASLLAELSILAYGGGGADDGIYALLLSYFTFLDGVDTALVLRTANAAMWLFLGQLGQQPDTDYDHLTEIPLPEREGVYYQPGAEGFSLKSSGPSSLYISAHERNFLRQCSIRGFEIIELSSLSHESDLQLFHMLRRNFEQLFGRALRTLEAGVFP